MPFLRGVCCGNPLPDDRIAQAMARNFNLFRTNAASATDISQEQFAKFGAQPLWIIGTYGHTVAGVQRTIAEVRKFPDGGLIELGNEPNLGDGPAGTPKLSPWEYAAIASDCRAEIEARGMVCYYGAVSSCDRGGQAWLRKMLGYAPWIERVSVHRYPYRDDQDPSRSAYGSRAAEMQALRSMLAGRRVLVTETGIMCPPVSEQQQLSYLQQEVFYWEDIPECAGVVVWVEGMAPQENYGLREGTDGRWRLVGSVFMPAPSDLRAVAVIVYNEAGQPVPGASCEMQIAPVLWQIGATDAEGYLEWPEVAGSLTASHLRVSADGYVPVDTHIDLQAGANQQIRLGLGYDPGQANAILLPGLKPAKLVPDHNPRKVRCNFGSLYDPILGRWIFQNMYPSMDADTRKRWREIAAAAGDTHFQQGNPTTPLEDYHDTSAYTDWLTSGQMDHWNACARELVEDGFTVIAYADSGDNYPGVGYHRRFFDAVPADLKAQMIGVPGHEIIPGGYSTKNGDDAIQEIAAAGVPLIAMHTGDDRLSWSSHPVEPDDPFHGDEIACWHGTSGHLLTHHFCQLRTSRLDDPLVDTTETSVVCEAHGISSRVDGSQWVDPNGKPSPDWGMSWIEPVLFETDEELVFKGQRTRAQILAVMRACLEHGFTGYGCGTPDMLR